MDWKSNLKRLYPVFLVLLVFIVWKWRSSNSQQLPLVEFSGLTMGTIGYNVKYFDAEARDFSQEIDSLLKVWNLSLSTYIPESEISRFNKGLDCFEFESEYFYPVLKASSKVFEQSNGAFDPTVGPLVNAWGFGPEKSMLPDSSVVDSLRMLVGFDKINFNENEVCKSNPGSQLDFSAVAKGYAVDVVADYLESYGIENLLVEIGGELLCKGTKNDDQPWRTAIEDPTVAVYERDYLAVVNLRDKAVATSGKYRNYYVKDGIKYAHTLDPKSGFPISHRLLSASVFAGNCMEADAYATAFMVLGLEKSKEILANNPELDAYLIYSKEDGEIGTFITDGIAPSIETVETDEDESGA